MENKTVKTVHILPFSFNTLDRFTAKEMIHNHTLS